LISQKLTKKMITAETHINSNQLVIIIFNVNIIKSRKNKKGKEALIKYQHSNVKKKQYDYPE